MSNKKPNIKNILILSLMFIIGFGAGMTVTFQIIFNRLAVHGISL